MAAFFTMSPSEVHTRASRFSFMTTDSKGMVEYQLKAFVSIEPHDIIIIKNGGNTIRVFRAGKHRFYYVIMLAEEYVKEHVVIYKMKEGKTERIEYYSPEEYCIEVEELGKAELPKELYDRIKVPRTITIFKNKELIEKILKAIHPLLNKKRGIVFNNDLNPNFSFTSILYAAMHVLLGSWVFCIVVFEPFLVSYQLLQQGII